MALIFFLMMFAAAATVHAAGEELPTPPKHLLEIGAGIGTGYSPDYPSANQSRMHFVPIPVVYYHGLILRSDREDGARARVVRKPIFGVDISAAGGFPISSEDNRARDGMSDLHWLGEIGPRGYVRLHDRRGQLWRLFLGGRAAFTTNFKKGQDRGYVLAPGMGFEHKRFLRKEVSLYLKLTSEFASKAYNDYFYTVDAKYARPERPAYKARSGYLGSYFTSGISYETEDYLISTGVSLMSHDGSANRASPLFKNEFNFAVFFGIAWFFYHSSQPGLL